jgi:hypothetical protein
MNRTYTYAELKDLINEELVNFNFIIESKHIFNQEFIGFRKFFKNLLKKQSKKKNDWFGKDQPESETNKKFDILYPYFEKVGGYRIYLNKETVADLSMTQLYKDFPNLKADYDLLLSLKEKVRSGKRPKDLEKDYEAERLKKAAEENKATCGICNQHWELVDMEGERQKFNLSKNVIADHGFTIRFGNGRDGVCFGARFYCWEKSPKVKIEYVKQVLQPTLDEVLKEKPTNKTVENIKAYIEDSKLAKKEYDLLPISLTNEYYRLKRDTGEKYFDKYITDDSCPENMKNIYKLLSRIGTPTIRFSGMHPLFPGIKLPKHSIEITLNLLVKIWTDYKQGLIDEINRFETAIKNWKLQPTPRERLGK